MEKQSSNKFSYEEANEWILQKQLNDVYISGISAVEEDVKEQERRKGDYKNV